MIAWMISYIMWRVIACLRFTLRNIGRHFFAFIRTDHWESREWLLRAGASVSYEFLVRARFLTVFATVIWWCNVFRIRLHFHAHCSIVIACAHRFIILTLIRCAWRAGFYWDVAQFQLYGVEPLQYRVISWFFLSWFVFRWFIYVNCRKRALWFLFSKVSFRS